MGTSSHKALVVAGPRVPLEPAAVDQLERIAALPGCLSAVGMPDLHAGPGVPIGASFAFEQVRPALVGTDAGCGARVTVVRPKRWGDALERRLRQEFDAPAAELANGVERAAAEQAWLHGPAGLASVADLPPVMRELAAAEPLLADLPQSAAVPDALPGLGSIGGGNHFAEVSRVDSVHTPQQGAAKCLKKGAIALLVHSGSRGVGAAIGRRWGDVVAAGEERERYLAELAGAVRFACANRFVLTWRLLKALGAAKAARVQHSFDVVHNSVVPFEVGGRSAWLHRKGCAPALAGQSTVVLGSRGAPSWIMRGCGHAHTLASVAHGAGRRLSRSDARARFRQACRRKSLSRTSHGGRVICRNPKLLFEEHPDAYKPIEPVIESLTRAGMAIRVASLMPQITVKQ